MKKFICLLIGLLVCLSSQALVVYDSNGNPFYTYTDSRDPTSNEGGVFNNIMPFYFYENTASGELFISTSQSNSSIVWRTLVTSLNLQAQLADLGWESNTSRPYVAVSSPSFNSSRMPSSTSDTEVVFTGHVNATVLQSSTLSAQEDCGSGFSEIGNQSTTLGVLVNQNVYMGFLISAGCSYKIVSSGTGTNTIVSLKEKSM